MSNPSATHSIQRTVGCWAVAMFGGLSFFAMLSAWFPGSGLHEFFAPACHQHPERTHWLGGAPMAVCVRCFWLYVGLAVGHAWFVFGGGVPAWRLTFLIASLAAAAIHWLVGWVVPNPDLVILRALTGFCVGAAASNYTLPGFVEWFSERSKRFSSSPYTYEPHRP